MKHALSSVLDDLISRFILNCPREELDSFDRLFFLIEQAHWYYEDFYREEDRSLPSFSPKEFARQVFLHYPPLHSYADKVDDHFSHFKEYKHSVPVCGLIILNQTLSKVLLVKGFNSRTWGFPKGKINKGEKEMDCAVREAFEEVGFDFSGQVEEENILEMVIRDQRVALFVVPGVSDSIDFVTRTRKEISKIAWHDISALPATYAQMKEKENKVYFLVFPFVARLKKWISDYKQQKRHRSKMSGSQPQQLPVRILQHPSITKRRSSPTSAQAKDGEEAATGAPSVECSFKGFDRSAIMRAFDGDES